MGEWRISDSFFITNKTANLASGGFGIVTFFRCHFDQNLATYETSKHMIFNECDFEAKMIVPSYTFTINSIFYDGPHFFNGETARPNNKPPKPKFVLSKRIGYIVGAIIFTIAFVIVTVLACNLLKRHRQHVLCSSGGGNKNAVDDDDDDLMIVVDEDEKLKQQILNDFDDYYSKTKNDKRFKFDDIPVPDTNLWDTDEGEVEVPDEDAFNDDVNMIFGGNSKREKSRKGKKKNKKKKKNAK